MIRGVDRKTRKAIKDAAKAEGASVGTWVRRALQRALDASADGPATVMDLSERLRVLGARLSVIEKSHNLHRKSARPARWSSRPNARLASDGVPPGNRGKAP